MKKGTIENLHLLESADAGVIKSAIEKFIDSLEERGSGEGIITNPGWVALKFCHDVHSNGVSIPLRSRDHYVDPQAATTYNNVLLCYSLASMVEALAKRAESWAVSWAKKTMWEEKVEKKQKSFLQNFLTNTIYRIGEYKHCGWTESPCDLEKIEGFVRKKLEGLCQSRFPCDLEKIKDFARKELGCLRRSRFPSSALKEATAPESPEGGAGGARVREQGWCEWLRSKMPCARSKHGKAH